MASSRYCAAVSSGLVLLAVSGQALALDVVTYGEQVLGPGKHAGTLEALGPALTGETINTYTGGISFSQTDISLPGNNGLPVALTRRLEIDGNKSPAKLSDENLWRVYSFGEWDWDLPYLSGTYAETSGWVVDTDTPNARCSSATTPNQFMPPSLSVGGVHFSNLNIWSGLTLNVSGQGEQKLALQPSSTPIPQPSGSWTLLTTASHWHFSCLASLQSGQAGEGFMALAPDGTKYYFDWMVAYAERSLRGSGVTIDPATSQALRSYVDLPRKSYRLYPTRIEDRFGNHVTYAWSGSNLISISASDGRSITLTYSGGRVASATDGTRTVSYAYTDGLLTGVTLPDGSAWGFSTAAVLAIRRYVDPAVDASYDFPFNCQLMRPLSGEEADLQMTHPSGAVVSYRLAFKRLYRTNRADTISSCAEADPVDYDGEAPPTTFWDQMSRYPIRYDVLSVKRKTLSGMGLATQTWGFSHQDTYSVGTAGYPVQGTRTVTTTRPDGSTMVDTFGTDVLANENQLLSSEVRNGSSVLSRTDNTYVQTSEIAGLPFPDWVGEPLGYDYIRGRGDYTRPMKQSVATQQGTAFTRRVDTFDAFARALGVTRFSPWYSRADVTAYHDNTSKWVLGQVRSVTNSNTGLVESQTDYDATMALPVKTYSFGKLQQTRSYDTSSTVASGQLGTLKTVADGNNNVTTLSSWKRGIPQTIKYPVTAESPSGATESAVVDDHGWITAVTDGNGYKTCYGYDVMGRLNLITYPSETQTGVCDNSAWTPTTITLAGGNTAAYGMPAGHWRQTTLTGNGRKTLVLDALWRPVVEQTLDLGNVSATLSEVIKRYDLQGRVEFQSYPMNTNGQANYADTTLKGVWTEYDALDRTTSVSQDSELGLLTTLTEYLTGFKTRITNPKGQQTTTSYLAYDQPSTDMPVAITHPEGAFTDIARDVFGKPTAFTRRNSTGSMVITRSYAYNANQELCRSVEPETGATLMGYDGAGNLAWSAAGLSSSLQCTNSNDSAVLARKATRAYDARNRVASLSFPDGLGNTTYGYRADGKLHTLSADNGDGNIVTTTYGYKRRGQISSERLQWGGVDLSVAYNYDGNGNLAAVGAPGLTVDYAPNALGQPTQAGSYATGVQYYPNGAIKQFTYGNGIVHTMTQNARQRPTRVVDSGGVLDNEYAYDANGNVQSMLDWRDSNQNRAMTYDGLDRLLTATSPAFATGGGGQVHQYAYDVLDNLVSWTRTGAKDYAQYVYVGNRLANIKDSANQTIIGLDYDVQGNLSNKNGQAYTFDYGNRLRTATGKGSYAYDGHGRRVLDRTTADKHSLYSQSGQLLYENDQRQARITQYVYLGGSLVARVVNSTAPAVPLLTAPAYNTSGSYAVSWTSSSGATGYQLEEAVSGGAWAAVYSGTGLSAAISGKSAGNYDYRVRSCLNAGCSAWSGTSSVSVQFPPATAPSVSAPTTATGGNYTLSWTSIAGTVEYKLQASFNSGAWTAAYTGAAQSQSYSNQPAGTYAYRVQACNPAGCGPYSATATVQSVYAPSTALTLTAPAVGAQGNFTVSWTSDGSATSYSLERNINSAGWTTVYTGTATSQSYTTQAAGSYGFRVKACNTAGCGSLSNTATVQALYSPSSAPSLTVPAIGASGTFAVSWSTVSGATSYVLYRSNNGGAWASIYSGASTSQSYSSHTAGTFSYRVTACNAAGCGPNSSTGTTQVIYAPASAPAVSAPATNGTGSYTVSWGSVSGATSYQLQESSNGGAWNGLYNGAATSLGVSGRTSATYGYRAVACNTVGCGPYSGTASTTVSYIPAVPTGLTGSKNTETEVQPPVTYWQVDWTASTGASRYEVEMQAGTGARSALYSGPNNYVTGTGIGTRQFWVRACSTAGCSAWSSPFTL